MTKGDLMVANLLWSIRRRKDSFLSSDALSSDPPIWLSQILPHRVPLASRSSLRRGTLDRIEKCNAMGVLDFEATKRYVRAYQQQQVVERLEATQNIR